MAASFTCADLSSELTEIQVLLSSRSANKEDIPEHGTMSASLAKALSSKIAHIQSMSNTDAAEVYTQLTNLNLPNEFKVDIKEAIDNRLIGATTTALNGVKPQWILDLNNYCTANEWASLTNQEQSYQSKVQVLVDRLVSLQVQSMHEQSVKYAVALLLTTHFSSSAWPSASSIHTMVVDFKRTFQSAQKIGTSRLMKYPTNPSDLPADMYARAYPDEASPPVARHIERMRLVAEQHIPLRSTSKMLKDDQAKRQDNTIAQAPAVSESFDFGRAMAARMMWPQCFPGYSPLHTTEQQMWAFQQELLSRNQQPALRDAQFGATGSHQQPALQHAALQLGARISPASSPESQNRDVNTSATLALKLPSSSSTALARLPPKQLLPTRLSSSDLTDIDGEDMDANDPASKAKVSTTEDYETEAFNALLKRSQDQARKRPAAAPAVAQKVKLPKSAAAPTVAQKGKTPKSAASSSSYTVSAEGADKLDKKTFTSRHYHAAHTAAKKAGKDGFESKSAARDAYKQAAEVWAAHQ